MKDILPAGRLRLFCGTSAFKLVELFTYQLFVFVEEADVFVFIGTSLVVYPAANLKKYTPRNIPRFIIDPADFNMGELNGYEHIKTTVVAGIDILTEKLKEF